MKPFLPSKYEFVAFGALLSGLMSLIVSGVSLLLSVGLRPGFFGDWLTAWLPSWAIAFPTILVVAPFVRRVLARIVIGRA